MELKIETARLWNGVVVIDVSDPPKLAERVGDPPVTVDPPGPQSVAYGIRRGIIWEAGSGVLLTKHGLKRTDGTRLVLESLERGSVLKSSQAQDAKLRLEEGDELEVSIAEGGQQLPQLVEAIASELSKAE